MTWKRCSLLLEHLASGELVDITNTFAELINTAAAPPDAMLFWRATSDGLELFASPYAGVLVGSPTLAWYGWTDCERPSQVDLMLLAGKGDADRLFLPHKVRLAVRNDDQPATCSDKELDADTA